MGNSSCKMARTLQLLAALAFLAFCAHATSPNMVVPETTMEMGFEALLQGPVGGRVCTNEVVSDLITGNHCVKLGGADLDSFEAATSQDFNCGVKKASGGCTEWCVCLHLYKSTQSVETLLRAPLKPLRPPDSRRI